MQAELIKNGNDSLSPECGVKRKCKSVSTVLNGMGRNALLPNSTNTDADSTSNRAVEMNRYFCRHLSEHSWWGVWGCGNMWVWVGCVWLISVLITSPYGIVGLIQ